MASEAEFDHSLRAVDLRIAIGRAYSFDFETRVAQSNSNSLAAIYFLRDQLDELAADLGVDPAKYDKHGLQDAIREACGAEPRGTDFDWRDLQRIIVALEIPIPDDLPFDPAATETPAATAADDCREASAPDGPWADWPGGESGAE